MATTYPIQNAYRVTTVDHGMFCVLGTVSPRTVGLWSVQFVPDQSFVGQLGVVGRIAGKDATDDAVGFGSIPYRRVQLGGVASDNAMVADAIPHTGALILVPASGLTVALLVDCTAGFGDVYLFPLEGHPAL